MTKTVATSNMAQKRGGLVKQGANASVESRVFQALIDIVPDRIYAKDRQSRFILANKAVARLMGEATPEEMIGKDDFYFYPQEIASQYFEVEQELLATGKPLIACEQQVPNLETHQPGWLQTTKVPLRDEDGNIIGLVGLARDITERKRCEDEIKRRSVELAEANAKLSQAQEQLVQSSKLAALGALVAGIAHELNTPIGNSVLVASTFQESLSEFEKSLAKGITRGQLQAFVDRTREGTEILVRSLARAAELVASFKQVAVDRTSVNRRRFNLKDTVAEILLTLSPVLRKTPHCVEAHIPDELVLDSYPGPLGQVLTALFNNALVHAFDGVAQGVISIDAELEEENSVRIVVRDNGKGIAGEHIGRVFDPFFTTRLGQGGSGLGLSVAYNLVNGILGGRIEVESPPGQGACFTLRLPIVAPATATPSSARE